MRKRLEHEAAWCSRFSCLKTSQTRDSAGFQYEKFINPDPYLNTKQDVFIKKVFTCTTLPVPSCHATRKKHEGWDTARLPKPRQGKSSGGGRIRTTDLLRPLHRIGDRKYTQTMRSDSRPHHSRLSSRPPVPAKSFWSVHTRGGTGIEFRSYWSSSAVQSLALLGFELRTAERVTTPPAHAGCI
ncbi:hypothetical protein T265_05274 [Opisthorchis viverrini]|uniref:Uncharacterized protein n=1 Tax=Opisthorchis viverrini TaxID=6198 RepID=A0A074ZWK4_OPIVI|nr:hypothetical protein T265_05274 [Opisthorchis viverrini]KER27715.1 hypothetical protein T265_05274 [Opisthorchis viverrini]